MPGAKIVILYPQPTDVEAFIQPWLVDGRKLERDSSTSRPDGNREDTISASKRLGTLRAE
jgi:hypothetical protein